jgi:hypothetical protein
VGTNGYRASGQVQYVIDRRTNVHASYSFSEYSFPRVFGDSNIHSLDIGFNRRLTRAWSIAGSFGGYRAESLGTQVVTLSPEIADLLGITQSIRAVYNRSTGTSANATASYAFRRQNFRMSYSRGTTPGNGVYLTSLLQSANAGYSYSGLRKISLSVNAGYTKYSSLFRDLNNYSSYQGGASANVIIRPHINGTASVDVRQFQIVAGQNRIGAAVAVGILLTPSRIPLPAW